MYMAREVRVSELPKAFDGVFKKVTSGATTLRASPFIMGVDIARQGVDQTVI